MRTLENKRVGRRLPVGAEPVGEDGVHFRVWAPLRTSVHVYWETGGFTRSRTGEWLLLRHGATGPPGNDLRYVWMAETHFPTRIQISAEGPHGPSQVVDPTEFNWTDPQWTGAESPGRSL